MKRVRQPREQILDGELRLWCRSCQEYYPASLEYFYMNNARDDGFQDTCIICQLERRREVNFKKKAERVAGNKELLHAAITYLNKDEQDELVRFIRRTQVHYGR